MRWLDRNAGFLIGAFALAMAIATATAQPVIDVGGGGPPFDPETTLDKSGLPKPVTGVTTNSQTSLNDWSEGIRAALTTALDQNLLYHYEWDGENGTEDFYPVTATYASTAALDSAGLCDSAAEVGTLQITLAAGVWSVWRCTVVATTGSAATDYDWREDPKPPGMWLVRWSAGATGAAFAVEKTGVAHQPAGGMRIGQTAAGECIQAEFLFGGGNSVSLFGRSAMLAQQLISLGYADDNIAAWGLYSHGQPTGMILDGTQSSPTTVFTTALKSGLGFLWWPTDSTGNGQFYGWSQRSSALRTVTSLGSYFAMTPTKWGDVGSAAYARGFLGTQILAEWSFPDTSGTWLGQYRGKWGFGFLMDHRTAWWADRWQLGATLTTNGSDITINQTNHEMRPFFITCATPAAGEYGATMTWARGTLDFAIYDYD
jgi:hypothetical protein